MLIGSHILSFFGISLPVVQVGGGLIVVANGWMLLQQREEPSQAQPNKRIHLRRYRLQRLLSAHSAANRWPRIHFRCHNPGRE